MLTSMVMLMWPQREESMRLEGSSFYSQVPKSRVTTCRAGPQGKCPGFGQGAEDRGKGLVQTWGFIGDFTRKGRQGKGYSLVLASLNNSSTLWAKGVICSCLRQRASDTGLAYEGWIRRWWDSELVGWYMRDVFSVEPIAEKGLTLGAAAASGAARFYSIINNRK